jgi:integrase
MILPHVFNYSEKAKNTMQQQESIDILERFLAHKFRLSKSYATITTYRSSVRKFEEFLRDKFNLDLSQLIFQVAEDKLDAIDLLNEFYSWLSLYKIPKKNKVGYSNESINRYIQVAKELLRDNKLKIYNEDVKQRFKLPKRTSVMTEGLTKYVINRLIRLANPKLVAVILIACSSGMRIAEIAQLKLSDMDFTKTPTQVQIRAETAKTREGRFTHISSEATRALQDYLLRLEPTKKNDDFLFLLTVEDRIRTEKSKNMPTKIRMEELEAIKTKYESSELYARNVVATKHNLQQQLDRIIANNPELNKISENGRREIHFHAFRYWFKTQVTDAHQSDFAEALMGHKSLKILYYRQHTQKRLEVYREIEYALTISDTEEIEKQLVETKEKNQELKTEFVALRQKMQYLEKRYELNN